MLAHRLPGSGCSGSISLRGEYPTDSGESGLQARQDRLESLPTDDVIRVCLPNLENGFDGTRRPTLDDCSLHKLCCEENVRPLVDSMRDSRLEPLQSNPVMQLDNLFPVGVSNVVKVRAETMSTRPTNAISFIPT